uniref:Ig-like domain-containing protein n=1 Tax=Amphilophus citrinellus TaxID=61819 RepID=A0A3Q0SRS0_AMPCI
MQTAGDQVYGPKFLSVSVSPSGEIQEGSSVTLTCSSDANPAANYTWYKEDGQAPLIVEPQLVFTSIQPSDSGEYYCTAVNKVMTSATESVSVDVMCKCHCRHGSAYFTGHRV